MRRIVPLSCLLALLAVLTTPPAAAQLFSWREVPVASPEPGTFMLYGSTVAVSGDTLAVGAVAADWESFAFYVFVRQGGTWPLQAIVRVANPGQEHGLPSLALSGDTMAVGLSRVGAAAAVAGEVHVFVRRGHAWFPQAVLSEGSAAEWGLFGHSVDVAGDTLAVGAPRAGRPPRSPGIVYLYRRTGLSWQREARLVPADVSSGAGFGNDVSLAPAGNVLAAGAHWDRTGSTGPATPGSVHVFRRQGATWTREIRFQGLQGAQLGETVSLAGGALVAGSALDSAFAYSRSNGVWHREPRLFRVTDSEATGLFGFYAGSSGRWAVVLGNRGPSFDPPFTGAYLYQRNDQRRPDDGWAPLGLLAAELPFITGFDVDADTIAILSAENVVSVFTATLEADRAADLRAASGACGSRAPSSCAGGR
jgi:hypothetical protein